MAGGAKETPRQRMIGMMYLVLTALLALQVSNVLLDKFQFIDETLQNAVAISRKSNKQLLEGIKSMVEKNGNKPADVAVFKKGEEVLKVTDDMMGYFNTYRDNLIKASGGVEEDGRYKGAKDQGIVEEMLIGPEGSKSGKGYELEKKLNDFVAQMQKVADSVIPDSASGGKPKIEKIAKAASEYPIFKNNDDQKTKDFVYLSYQGTPMVAALAITSQMQSEALKAETAIIEALAKLVGINDIKFDKIFARVTAESKVVAAGTKYKASMFIAATSSTITPRMTSTAGGVKVNADGVGEIEFTAQGGGYDKEGKAEKSWKGSITIKTPSGRDTTFSVEEKYTVVKPVIDIQAANVASLYLRCGNELNVQVPALGQVYAPRFTCSDTEVIPGSPKGMVTLVPRAAKVTLTVYSGSDLIGTRELKVSLVPKPEIKFKAGGKELNSKVGGPMPRSVQCVAEADESFKKFLPKDARYRVTEVEVMIGRGKKAIFGPTTMSGPEINLNSAAANAQAGDRLILDVKKVERMNFKNEREAVSMGSMIFTYPIN
ncbi:MAG: gliding motility protein GldM [Cytophagales bacterium]|nr:MAG: gliding motility protein GldM [Cytophagales bacterium]TAF59393.1 MAG: gliding motility protein GldM [Cytophagales bacterium]